MSERENTKILGTFLAALLIGAGLGVLFTPQSGRRTRKDIERLGRRTKDVLWDFQENFRENVDDFVDEVTEITKDGLERGKEISEEKKVKILAMIESGERYLSEQKANLKKLFK